MTVQDPRRRSLSTAHRQRGRQWQMLMRQARSALNPALGLRLGSFRRVTAAAAAVASGRTVAVVGLVPGAGASTVAAVMALTAAGYCGTHVLVIDTNRAPRPDEPDAGRPAAPFGGRPSGSTGGRTGRRAGSRRVAALLGGSGDGRLSELSAIPDERPAARAAVRGASVLGTAVPVLALAAGHFAPQTLAQTLARVRHRADLVIIDTPSDRAAPVFHAVLHLVDQVVLVVPADRLAAGRLEAARHWLAAAPGPARRHDVSVVLISRSGLPLRWRPDGLPCTVLRPDRALRRGRPGVMSRRSVVSGLRLVAAASPAPTTPPTG